MNSIFHRFCVLRNNTNCTLKYGIINFTQRLQTPYIILYLRKDRKVHVVMVANLRLAIKYYKIKLQTCSPEWGSIFFDAGF